MGDNTYFLNNTFSWSGIRYGQEPGTGRPPITGPTECAQVQYSWSNSFFNIDAATGNPITIKQGVEFVGIGNRFYSTAANNLFPALGMPCRRSSDSGSGGQCAGASQGTYRHIRWWAFRPSHRTRRLTRRRILTRAHQNPPSIAPPAARGLLRSRWRGTIRNEKGGSDVEKIMGVW